MAWPLLCAAFALASCTSDPIPAPDPVDHLTRARAHFAATRFEEAAAAARAGLARDSTNADLHNVLASSHAAQGRYALAIESLETTVRLKPDFAMGFVNLGGIYTKLGQYDRADTYLQRAVQLNPDNSPVRRRLGELYLATGRYAEATRELLEALRLFPNDATLYYYLGQSLAAEGRQADALEAFQRATLLDIGFADAFYRLATLARKVGRDTLAQGPNEFCAPASTQRQGGQAAARSHPQRARRSRPPLQPRPVLRPARVLSPSREQIRPGRRPAPGGSRSAQPPRRRSPKAATTRSCAALLTDRPRPRSRVLSRLAQRRPHRRPTQTLRRGHRLLPPSGCSAPRRCRGLVPPRLGPVQQWGTRRGRTGVAPQSSAECGRCCAAH